MRLFNKVAIIGLGLMGGSLGLVIKKKKIANLVIGISRTKKTLKLAKERKAIDFGSQNLKIIKDADLLIFATPIETILDLAYPVSRVIKEDCIVTDIGSTKEKIVSRLSKIFKHYLGSHPLAGSEKSSILYAHENLFKNSLCVLTPHKNTSSFAFKKIRLFWQNIGAKVVYLSPKEHDKILSLVSHLPHAVSFSLISAIPKEYLKFASGGLRDTTRIASSEPKIWTDIFLSNPKNILTAIELFEDQLKRLKSCILKKDRKNLTRLIIASHKKRKNL